MAPRPHTLPLILAIDGDRGRRADIAALIRDRVAADLCQAPSAAEAIAQLQDRVPDLILTSPLLSPRDDDAIAAYLRQLGERGTHVQTLRIPLLGRAGAMAASEPRGLLARLLAPPPPLPQGCDPRVFADEIVQYLVRATAARQQAAGGSESSHAGDLPAGGAPPPRAGEHQDAIEPEWMSERDLPPAVPAHDRRPDAASRGLAVLSLEEFLQSRDATHCEGLAERVQTPVGDAGASAPASDPVLDDFQEALLALELGVGSAELTLLDAGDAAASEDAADPLADFASEADLEQPAPTHGQQDCDAGSLGEWTEPDKPMQDEWGLFDPDQCGFAALVARLDRFSRKAP